MKNLITLNIKGQMVLITNNSNQQEVLDEEGYVIKTFPVGMVLRYIPKGQSEPTVKIAEGVFTTEFKDEDAIKEYIISNNLLS